MKKKPKSAGNIVVCETELISKENQQIEDRIRQRAFEISQTRGHSGREMDDWLTAEAEIISTPPAELVEKDDTFVLQLAVGNIDPTELHVFATADQMLIKADFRHSHDSDGGKIHLCDFRSATVFRSIRLPQSIDVNSISAEFSDGMLRITALRAGAVPPRPKRSGSVRR
jgi:HSP20 family molecular chaperone IbpA